jgi:hypothetical protein
LFLWKTLEQLVSSVVQAPFRSKALAEKLIIMPTVMKSTRLTEQDMLHSPQATRYRNLTVTISA